MSLPILTPSDFTGPYRISTTIYSDETLTDYISTYEREWLIYLLSDQAYIDIRDTSPLPQKYTDLINGVTWYDSSDDKNKSYIGLKEILKKILYFVFMADDYKETPTGKTQNLNENSTRLSGSAIRQAINRKYNEGVTQYICELVPFVLEYDDLSQDITGFTDDGGGTYTIQTASTKYLSDGDTVVISGAEYIVANLVADTSFEIDAGVTGLTFSGEYSYEPFFEFNLPKLDLAWL